MRAIVLFAKKLFNEKLTKQKYKDIVNCVFCEIVK